jgi:hypothetical protein
MVRSMTPEEYARLFNRPVESVPPVETTNGSSNGDTAMPAEEMSDLEIALYEQASVDSYQRKFIRTGWQDTDIFHLLRYHDQHSTLDEENAGIGIANWSEMGCYKTSTGLWLLDRLVKEAETRKTLDGPKLATQHPAILIITSKGGKGTFLEAVPEILPEYTILNIETQALFYYKNGHMLKLSKDLKFVPKEFAMPVICIAHYNIFARSNFGKFMLDEEGMPMQKDGKFLFQPWNQADYIMNREWDIVWCDEFHRIKDRDAKQSVNIKKIPARVAKHGSTGTGFINRPDEIWSLLNWLYPKRYGSYWAFREEFCETDDWDGYEKVVGCKPEKLDEFRELVRSIGVRRTLSEVMPDIKVPIFKPITVQLNPTQRKMYDQIKMELAAEDQKGTPLYAANVLSMLQRLRQICVGTPEVIEDIYDPILDRRVQKIKLTEPSSKLDAVMEIIEDLQWDDDLKEPLVVFSNFKDPLELLKARLDKHNEAAIEMGLDDMLYKYIHLDVGDSDIERYHKWHDEFPKLEHRIFMSTLQLGGESINLTPARHIVFLDRSWSPKDNAQGIGRVRRPGQTGQPVVMHINAEKTTDQYIERVNDIKHGWFMNIFGNEEL